MRANSWKAFTDLHDGYRHYGDYEKGNPADERPFYQVALLRTAHCDLFSSASRVRLVGSPVNLENKMQT